jgi:hypothetical protein
MRRSIAFVVLGCLTLVAPGAEALVISLGATPATVASGGDVVVNVVASDLDEGGLVSAYDIGIEWDSGAFAFRDGSFVVGSALGSVVDQDFFDFTLFVDDGSILPFVVSLLPDSELLGRQSDRPILLASFGLVARRTPQGLTGSIGLTCNSVAGASDGEGIAELLDVDSCNGASVTIEPAAVPAPGTLPLLGLGLVALALRSRRIRFR